MEEMYQTAEGQLTKSTKKVYVADGIVFNEERDAKLYEKTGIKSLKFPEKFEFGGEEFAHPSIDPWDLEVDYTSEDDIIMSFAINDDKTLTLKRISYWDRCAEYSKEINIGESGYGIKGISVEAFVNGIATSFAGIFVGLNL